MAYEPKTWECGDVVTADALNHIEQGIAESGGGTVEVSKIKIGTANGGFTNFKYADADTPTSTKNETGFNGSGQMNGSEVLELIGNKTIVNIEVLLATNEEPTKSYTLDGIAFGTSNDNTPVDLALASREELASIVSCVVTGLSPHGVTSSTPGFADIYAICI